ncbi:hypothetical protein B0A48_01190 [Cryoendolithus antarcticus]|uniref:DUF7611 domain-containing protein n=1 Tax=Cryoendolithus antarcticus TaxID=1507870 RepID=A0A1V8TSL1_9PEZI|nr:hypothetical protein B0A48_01190 [Cryoendolithus antarcticus]
MGDDDSKRSRLKSKWNRILKPRRDPSENEVLNNVDAAFNPDALPEFALSSDVADFLKPSTDKARPKLDIAIATRWPSSHEVRSASYRTDVRNVNGWSKPRRREGLTATFARTAPDIIGHGGDATLDPTSEIGRLRSRRQRSVSDVPLVEPGQSGQQPRQAQAVDRRPTEARPSGPLRAQTSLGEVSAPLERLHLTGDGSFLNPEQPRSTARERSSGSPSSTLKYNAMRASEGLTLRRASMVPEHSDDDQSSVRSSETGGFSQHTTESPEIRIHEAASPFSPDGPSPFADPKYFRRRSRDVSPASRHTSELQKSPDGAQSPYTGTVVSPPAQQYIPYKPAAPLTLTQNTLSDQRSHSSERSRPSSSQSNHSISRRPVPSSRTSPAAAETALQDFATRISHMSGVFRLTAEKARPSSQCTPTAWLRAALWWYIHGKLGLETLLARRPRTPGSQPLPEHLTQAHVDLAKAYWVLTEPLAAFSHSLQATSVTLTSSDTQNHEIIHRSCSTLLAYFTSLTASLARANILPPTDSLIQGQDTTIWLSSPALDPHAIKALSLRDRVDPLTALPLGDTQDSKFCGRYMGQLAIYTMETVGRSEKMPCIISLLRDKIDGRICIIIAGQSEEISLRFGQSKARNGIPWEQTKWRPDLAALGCRSQDGWFVDVTLGRRDYDSLYAGVHGSSGQADSTTISR